VLDDGAGSHRSHGDKGRRAEDGGRHGSEMSLDLVPHVAAAAYIYDQTCGNKLVDLMMLAGRPGIQHLNCAGVCNG